MNQSHSFNVDRSVNIGEHATGSAIQAGDGNVASVHFQQASLPQPETIDIQAELAALKAILTQLESTDQCKIENALEDAEEELRKPEPNKDEVCQALDRALTYAEKANDFAEVINKLQPHVEKTAGWLGRNWYKLLAIVGIAI